MYYEAVLEQQHNVAFFILLVQFQLYFTFYHLIPFMVNKVKLASFTEAGPRPLFQANSKIYKKKTNSNKL